MKRHGVLILEGDGIGPILAGFRGEVPPGIGRRHGFEIDRRRIHPRPRPEKIAAPHKATVFKKARGLFLEAVRAAAASHPEIKLEEELVDDAANGLIAHPESYDALPAPNLFGDILSDEAAALAGSLAASANPGEGAAVFLPVRHGPCYNALAAAWRSVRPPTGPASATPWRGGRSAP